MLIRFGAENFSSFDEGVDISFDLGGQCPSSIKQGNPISTILCLKGANSSGKTNILKILAFLKYFCSESFKQDPKEPIPVDSFFFSEKDTYIYCQFQVGNYEYFYEVSLNRTKVINEKLTRKAKRETLIFHRIENKLSSNSLKSIKELFNRRFSIRDNASMIDILSQLQFSPLELVYNFFNNIFTNVKYFGLDPQLSNEYIVSEYLYNNESELKFVERALKVFEPNLEEIQIEPRDINGRTIYEPFFLFRINGEPKILAFYLMSSGTKSLYKSLLFYRIVINNGGLLVLDEFDINLHPLILPFLTDLFLDSEINKKNAQFIFTTHNSDIMDKMTKYRTYLVNKDEGASYAYRLDEIDSTLLRNDRSIAKVYNQSKIGGVPNQDWELSSIW